jgi:DNA-binding transcriptional LysR family regulator
MIELRHLRAFRAVMACGSTVEAARELGVSQPTISRLLGELEAARRQDLFVRANGRLAPTAAAEIVLAEVERGLNAIDGVIGGARDLPLTIAAPAGLVAAVLAPACAKLRLRFPDLPLSVELMSYHDTLNAVAMGRADIGLVKEPAAHPALDRRHLATVGTDVVLPRGHRLAARDVIAAEDLAGEPLVLLGRHRPVRIELEDALLRAGVRPRVAIETHAVSIACRFVALGLGLTLANALLARAEAGGALVTRPFAAEIRHGFALVTARSTRRRRLFEAVSAYVTEAIDALLEQDGNGWPSSGRGRDQQRDDAQARAIPSADGPPTAPD